MGRVPQKPLEPAWYGIGKYIPEGVPKKDKGYSKSSSTDLRSLSDKEIFRLELIVRRQNKKDLLELIELEEKRRYLSMIIRWFKKIEKGIVASKEEREQALEEVNEIIRRGFNDYQEDLFCIWPDVEKEADSLARKLPECQAKQRYEVARNLVEVLMYNFTEKILVK
ncbi:MAG: hypothetical protein QXF25_01050, partial [Candidatus Pacearchaeota archaeon]